MSERRRAVVFLGMPQIARMLALPEGMRAVAARDDFFRDGVAVLVEGDILDPQPDAVELPHLPLSMLDRTELAMRADVGVGGDREAPAIEVGCPLCAWSREWDRPITLALLAGAVQQHLIDVHPS